MTPGQRDMNYHEQDAVKLLTLQLSLQQQLTVLWYVS